MIIRPYGAEAFLLECSPDQTLALLDQLDAALVPLGSLVTEVVPGSASIMVRHRSDPRARAAVRAAIGGLVPAAVEPAPAEAVRLRVDYDGPDLELVAAATGLTVPEVISRHRRADYRVAFCGFAPGFAYLVGLDPILALPRRPSPRPRVPAGSVAIAEQFSAIYPTASPGGWHLLGSCEAVLFDPGREPPAILQPGTVVRFDRSEPQ